MRIGTAFSCRPLLRFAGITSTWMQQEINDASTHYAKLENAMKLKKTFAHTLAALGLLVATPALAQETQPETAELAAADVTDAQVSAFIEAVTAVEKVRQEYIPRIQELESEDERNALIQEADTEAKQAIEGVENLSPAEFMAIGQAAQTDKDLQARIVAEMETPDNEASED